MQKHTRWSKDLSKAQLKSHGAMQVVFRVEALQEHLFTEMELEKGKYFRDRGASL